ncbi:MAG: cysteine desulfurase family protein, partial [Desulfuromonadales bacterium]
MRRIYMDHNATTSLHPAVIEEMEPFLRTRFGNPSSLHWAGRQVRPAIDQARERVARLVNCDPAEVVFTSCATESNNTAIKGVTAALRERGNHLITTTVEHPAVLTPCLYLEFFGFRVTCLEVDENGMLDPAALEAAIDERTILISAMYANNETGVIFPVERIGEVAARRKVVFHCDAAQAVGKIPIDFRAANIDLMSLSGHKLYAPKGVGALIVRRGVKL